MRVVLDTNTFISSLLTTEGPSARTLDAWRARRYDLIISPQIIAEFIRVTHYPRIRRKYLFTDDDVNAFVALLERYAQVVHPAVDVSGSVPADPQDEMIVACAVAGSADLIVSGDHHLLDLVAYQGIRVVTPVQFLEELERIESEF